MKKTVHEWIAFFKSDEPRRYGIDAETAKLAVDRINGRGETWATDENEEYWFVDLFDWDETSEGDALWVYVDNKLNSEPVDVPPAQPYAPTRRDLLAAAALTGLLANPGRLVDGLRNPTYDVQNAVKIADLMIAELNK